MINKYITTLCVMVLFVGAFLSKSDAFHVSKDFTVNFGVWASWSPFYYTDINAKDLTITFVPKSGNPINKKVTFGQTINIDNRIDLKKIVITGNIELRRIRIPYTYEGDGVAKINQEITADKFLQENWKIVFDNTEGNSRNVGANGKTILKFDDNKNLTAIELGSWTRDLDRLTYNYQ